MQNKSWPLWDAWKEIFGKDCVVGARAKGAGEAVAIMKVSHDQTNNYVEGDYYMSLDDLFHDEVVANEVVGEHVIPEPGDENNTHGDRHLWARALGLSPSPTDDRPKLPWLEGSKHVRKSELAHGPTPEATRKWIKYATGLRIRSFKDISVPISKAILPKGILLWDDEYEVPNSPDVDTSEDEEPSDTEAESCAECSRAMSALALAEYNHPTFIVVRTKFDIKKSLKISVDFWMQHIRPSALEDPIYLTVESRGTWLLELAHSESKIWVKKGWDV
ncbi:hypothetical protein SASPL_129857 [Salvia splendens]|uniref:Uncharacterized protein n=1 Tax=Salvia splendens TaxID=180675 RepID=A0A8X8XE39_SALSN|nr:hypothetical protein SASPL_129857 [Salvia splendens]